MAQPVSELGCLRQEAVEHVLGVDQASFVRRDLRHLDAEPEIRRDGRGPAKVGRRAMGLVERRVNLDGGETASVPFEVRTLGREAVGMLLRKRPSGAADADDARGG
jgi:hypothetical protein